MDEIEIVNYNPDWVDRFERESASIRTVLGKDLVTGMKL